jgi:hypothetical protein
MAIWPDDEPEERIVDLAGERLALWLLVGLFCAAAAWLWNAAWMLPPALVAALAAYLAWHDTQRR